MMKQMNLRFYLMQLRKNVKPLLKGMQKMKSRCKPIGTCSASWWINSWFIFTHRKVSSRNNEKTYEDGKLGIWLSEQKRNVIDVTKLDNKVECI